jgi:hypothetical protein
VVVVRVGLVLEETGGGRRLRRPRVWQAASLCLLAYILTRCQRRCHGAPIQCWDPLVMLRVG